MSNFYDNKYILASYNATVFIDTPSFRSFDIKEVHTLLYVSEWDYDTTWYRPKYMFIAKAIYTDFPVHLDKFHISENICNAFSSRPQIILEKNISDTVIKYNLTYVGNILQRLKVHFC